MVGRSLRKLASAWSSLKPKGPQPLTLPEIVDLGWLWGAAVHLLTVDIGSVELRPHFHGEDLKVRVKYGPRGRGVCCETCPVRASKPPRPAAADFVARAATEYQLAPAVMSVDTTCLFRGCREGKPCLQFSLVSTSSGEVTIARAEIPEVPVGTQELSYDLELLEGTGWKKQCVGHMSVKVEWQTLHKAALECALRVMGAMRQEEAFIASHVPAVLGVLVDTDGGSDSTPVLQGQVLNSHGRRAGKNAGI